MFRVLERVCLNRTPFVAFTAACNTVILWGSMDVMNQRIPVCYFSGHSHWATIKHDKAKEDIKRSSLYAKLSKSISAAVQAGGNDPREEKSKCITSRKQHQAEGRTDGCTRCQHAEGQHRTCSKWKESEQETGKGYDVGANQLQSATYEGFGPGSCAIIVECLTDNKKRTVSEIRHLFSKSMGNLGSAGCASRLFNYIGTITVAVSTFHHAQFPKDDKQEHIFDLAIELGADDVVEDEEANTVVVECQPKQLHAINEGFRKEHLEGKMEFTYKPLV